MVLLVFKDKHEQWYIIKLFLFLLQC